MAAHDAILGLAVKEVLAQYSGDAHAVDPGYRAVYEQHFRQVAAAPGGGGDAVGVELARQHFASLLQGDAFEAILARVVQQGGAGGDGHAGQQLTKEQFLVVTHLVSRTLEAAQNSDALWMEPAPPVPSGQKKRHPTVQEALGPRIRAHWGAQEAAGLPDGPARGEQLQQLSSEDEAGLEGSKENVGAAANAAPPAAGGGSKQPSPSVLLPRGRAHQAHAAAAAGSDMPDITDFERKLQELMHRMQVDQAKLQGRPVQPLTLPDSPDDSPQPGAGGSEPSSDSRSWESFNHSPNVVPEATAEFPAANPFAAAFPSTSPLAEGAAAGSAFEDFFQQQQQQPAAPPLPSPFSELNPVQCGQQAPASGSRAVAMGLPVGAVAPAYASPEGGLLPQQSPLYTTPVAGLPGTVAAPLYFTPEGQQRGNQFAGALDPAALAAAMQQLSLQQALAAQMAASGGRGAPALHLNASDPAAAAAIARAQAQLEAAAASLVAAATGHGALPRSVAPSPSVASQADSGGSAGSQRSSLDAAAGGAGRHVPFTARTHVHAHAPRLDRHLSAPSHMLGPLGAGAGEHRSTMQPRPSRLSHQSPAASASAPGSAQVTARATPQAEPTELAGWQPMPPEDRERCQQMFAAKGYEALGGMSQPDAQQLFARLQMSPHLFAQAWAAADIDGDGILSKPEFCLFMYFLRQCQRGHPLPARLSPDQAAALLGLGQGEAQAQHAGPAGGGEQAVGAAAEQLQPIKVDLMRIRSALRPGSRPLLDSASATPTRLQQEFDQDDQSDSDDSGFDDTLSVSSRCSSRLGPMQPLRAASVLFRPSLQSGYSQLQRFESMGGVVHSHLAINIRGAEIRYSKPLEKPFFNISVHDSLLRTVELPQDTPPGHYRKEARQITLNHAVELQTPLSQMPRGSVVYIELKHFKSREGRMSTLAWTYLTLEKVVDFGPVTSRVRDGPLSLPLFRKPMDLSLRRLKRVGRTDDLRLTITGIA